MRRDIEGLTWLTWEEWILQAVSNPSATPADAGDEPAARAGDDLKTGPGGGIPGGQEELFR